MYNAWGEHAVLDKDNNVIASDSEAIHNHIGYLNPIRYRSYYYDVETNLYFLQSRYYDPEIGRFINQDDVSYIDPHTVNGLNLYAYCGNNPVMRTDATGNWWVWDKITGGVKTAANAVGNVFNTVVNSKAGQIIGIAGAIITMPFTGPIGWFAAAGGIASMATGGNAWQGMAKGVGIGTMVSLSVIATLAGISSNVALKHFGSALIGTGVGSFIGLGSNTMSQIRSNGWNNFDLGKAAISWLVGGAIGGTVGTLAKGFKLIGNSIGTVAGFEVGTIATKFLSQAGIAVNIAKVMKIGTAFVGLIGGIIGGQLGNFLATRLFADSESNVIVDNGFPAWMITFIEFLKRLLKI